MRRKLTQFIYRLGLAGFILGLLYFWQRPSLYLAPYRTQLDPWAAFLLIAYLVMGAYWLFRLPERFDHVSLRKIDEMEGDEFEHYTAYLLKHLGYRHIHVTNYEGDQGIDVLAERHGEKWGFQCKRWQAYVGNKAVQEVWAGKGFYDLDQVAVITNSHFTRSARALGNKLEIELIDREGLKKLINEAH
ncbi:Restriction endonuclease [Lactobacillus selangorensis]|uniref:Restriction endonuclease n=1 Tax=Lactobacillus selangorensis TaxID=81857 RepID=A0A0R2G2U9_9LACO|nr:restriction endonuclease [Lactobacillus selangorensis]KRN28378.1 Restriction endonuclease [Lactobacillus selangorensis]KRN31879.1 Restriction endonuclease [Lactobacillus selangorensis]